MAKAFAALAKLAYCGPGPVEPWESGPHYGGAEQLPGTVRATCGKLCEEANFTVGKTLLVGVAAYGQDNAQFAYVSQVLPTQRREPAFAQCVIALRGTWVQPANRLVNSNHSLLDFQSPSCPSGCQVAAGPYGMYLEMEPAILQKLDALGCPAGSTIAVTGHSLGGEVASIAMFFLAERRGYNIALSYTFEQPKAFNRRAVEVMERVLTRDRPVSFFRVTNRNDWVVRIPLDDQMYQAGYQVWFYGSALSVDEYRLCGTQLEATTGCGADGIPLDQLCKMTGNPEWLQCGEPAPLGSPHCNHPLAPALSFCSMGGSMQDVSNSPLVYGYTCVLGDTGLPEHAILPTFAPAAWPIPTKPRVMLPVPSSTPAPLTPAPMPPLQDRLKDQQPPEHPECFKMNTSALPKPMLAPPATVATSAIACQQLCRQTAYCEMFSWTPTNQSAGTCELTGAWGDYTSGQTGVIAGPSNCMNTPPALSTEQKAALYRRYTRETTAWLFPQLVDSSGQRTGSSPASTTTAAPSGGRCTWRRMGSGSCSDASPGGTAAGRRLRPGGLQAGGWQAAKDACCSSSRCRAFRLDETPNTYVLLERMGTLDGSKENQRECWEKVAPEKADVSVSAHVSGAEQISAFPLPILATVLTALAAAA
mmetsp:Transcript_51115/g.152867  ORF Transcript_51115/g.152867 Transcript_51115/m.152867 type:complete len:645 (+) Transcript_51115:2-1936(+)